MRYFIRLFFRTIRLILGPVLLLWEWLSTPKGIKRPDEEQQNIDQETEKMTVYQFKTCPFCIKTRRAIKRLSLNISFKDAQKDPVARKELAEGGGTVKVPCLRIDNDNGEIEWLYESDDIISYLEKRYSQPV